MINPNKDFYEVSCIIHFLIKFLLIVIIINYQNESKYAKLLLLQIQYWLSYYSNISYLIVN